jgi:hypothetical protein
MKNLKKLSVVLFATLLSFNFTSCIDDGVSDAVDQVYLAQAQFLIAQAALKEAEAQFALAMAAHEQAEAALTLAMAEVQLAYARETDAYTAYRDAQTEGLVIQNLYDAALNALILEKKQAECDLLIAQAQNALEVANAQHQATMITLQEAIADANDMVVMELYWKYDIVIDELEYWLWERVDKLDELNRALLYLHAPDSSMITQAYYMAGLSADSAATVAAISNDMALIGTYNGAIDGLAAAQPNDIQVMISEFDALLSANEDKQDSLKYVLTQDSVRTWEAWQAWTAASAQYEELFEAKDLHDDAVAALKEHTDQMAADSAAIVAHQDTIDVHIPAAEDDKAAALAAYLDAIDDLEAAQAALGGMGDDFDDYENDWVGTVNPTCDDDLSTGTTLYDLYWNAAIAAACAEEALACAQAAMAAGNPNDFVIQDLEMAWMAATSALETYTPGGLTVAELQAILDDANAEEEAATEAFLADPDGFLEIDLDEDNSDFAIIGDHTDDGDSEGDKTWRRVATFVEIPLLSGNWYPETYYPEEYVGPDYTDNADFRSDMFDLFDDEDTEANNGGTNTGTYDLGNDSDIWLYDADGNSIFGGPDPLELSNAEAQNSMSLTTVDENIDFIVFVNVETDDDAISNFARLQAARQAVFDAQIALDLENGAFNTVQEAVDDAYDDLAAAYACLGYDIEVDINGTLDASDYITVTDYIAALALAVTNGDGTGAADLEADAAADVAAAIFAIGNTFAEYDDPAEWVKLGNNAAIDECTYADVTAPIVPTLFELVECAIIEWNLACIALENLEDPSWWWSYGGSVDSHEDAIAWYWARIAENAELIPSHEYAIEYLLGVYEGLLAEFDFDLTLWDFEGGHGLPDPLHYLPLYAEYLDALAMEMATSALIQECIDAAYHLQMLRDSMALNLGGFTSGDTVGEFALWVAAEINKYAGWITNAQGRISDNELALENIRVALALGEVSQADMEARVAECEAILANIETKISLLEAAAADLIERLNAAMAN